MDQHHITSKRNRRRTVIIIGIVIVLSTVSIGFVFLWRMGDNVGYAPAQPIPFSHKLHAGSFEIPCAYCHVGVEKSKHATVPAMNICMNCHRVVKTDSPSIVQFTELYNKKKPIEWVRVHDLPDHVKFTHERHINKAIACETCHGDVKKMDRIEQVKTLQMGFCVECHRKPENNASINCESCHH